MNLIPDWLLITCAIFVPLTTVGFVVAMEFFYRHDYRRQMRRMRDQIKKIQTLTAKLENGGKHK